MAMRTTTYKGRSIRINDDPAAPEVYIDDQRVPVSKTPGGYLTPLSFYRTFDTLDDLARAVAMHFAKRSE
jgi:hypothetical protein